MGLRISTEHEGVTWFGDCRYEIGDDGTLLVAEPDGDPVAVYADGAWRVAEYVEDTPTPPPSATVFSSTGGDREAAMRRVGNVLAVMPDRPINDDPQGNATETWIRMAAERLYRAVVGEDL